MSDINITISGKKRLLTAGKYCDKNIVITPVGGGDFSGEYVIQVDELPTENIDENAVYLCGGAYYKYAKELVDVIECGMSWAAYANAYNTPASFNVIPTKTTDGILDISTGYHFYYIEDEDDVFLYSADAGWFTFTDNDGTPYLGTITDMNEATSSEGYYALMTRGWTKYLSPTGTLEITKSGTYDVSEYASAEVNVAVPMEVETEAEMTALLETAEIGSVYKYIGASGTYETDALYVVEESE